jgi:antirestriction protein ArdC
MSVTVEANTKASASTKALEILHAGVTHLMTSDGWREALKVKSRFHQYSFFNSMLILSQKPDATLVAGYRKWLELKRFVRRGEKGLVILAPMLKRDPDAPETTRLIGFKTAYVFDISQTDGEPLPQPVKPTLLAGDSERIQQLLAQLEVFATSQGIQVRLAVVGSALGVYRPLVRQISLRPDLKPLQRLKTFVHELAHALLHDLETQRNVAELEAESCAFLVCHELGLDTSQYSFAYLAHWAPSLEALIQAGERASRAAAQILKELQNLEGR